MYAAQENVKFDAEIAEKGRFGMKTRVIAHKVDPILPQFTIRFLRSLARSKRYKKASAVVDPHYLQCSTEAARRGQLSQYRQRDRKRGGKSGFAYGCFFLLAGISLLPACPPAGPSHATKLAVKADVSLEKPFSIKGMALALGRIDAARAAHALKPIFLKYEKAFKVEPKNPFKRFLWAYSMEDRNQGWQEMAKVIKLNEK